jgi:16S rRNA (guanine966-N2)-methyltransferase
MRIISGRLKGRSINFLKNIKTRPLKDIVKENIFNILEHSNLFNIKLKNSNVLDLYSGIGSFGIECISRGADKVTFIERDKLAYNILKKNLNKLSITDKAKMFNDNIETIIKKNIIEKYNIFFFDPPFDDVNFITNLKLIKEKKLFKNNHIIILHRERKANDDLKNYLNIIESKNYGRSKIIFGLIS